MVSTIKSNNPLLIFEGYLNQKETSKKVLKNVFKKGDSVFVSGLCFILFFIFKLVITIFIKKLPTGQRHLLMLPTINSK